MLLSFGWSTEGKNRPSRFRKPMLGIRRREFISLVGGAAAWPIAARGQQSQRMRRIAVLMNLAADDPEGQARNALLLQGLQELGWTVGRNVRIDYRWVAGDAAGYRENAMEVIELAPDIVVASGSASTAALQLISHTVPIVFAGVVDPVGAGLVASLPRPGGNATGFASPEYGFSGKSIELLKEIAPRLTRVAVLRDTRLGSGTAILAAIQAVAPSFGVELTPIGLRNAEEIEQGIAAFARGPSDGLIVAPNTAAAVQRKTIIALAAKYKMPAFYPYRYYPAGGGLISYGFDLLDQWRLVPGYVDRILKGEKPSALPVQTPTRYELVINLKTAKVLGLDVSPQLLARADEVIE
jgi:putative ABC transport system substrate-binding protein